MDIVYLDRLSFQPADPQGVPTGDPEIVTKGNPVPDYVPPFVRSALIQAGAVVQVADDLTEEQIARRFTPAAESPRALPNPEQPSTPDGLPPLFDLAGGGAPTGGGTAISTGEAPAKPSVRDSKQAWEDYAVATGMDRGMAESKTKAELIAEVEGRENA